MSWYKVTEQSGLLNNINRLTFHFDDSTFRCLINGITFSYSRTSGFEIALSVNSIENKASICYYFKQRNIIFLQAAVINDGLARSDENPDSPFLVLDRTDKLEHFSSCSNILADFSGFNTKCKDILQKYLKELSSAAEEKPRSASVQAAFKLWAQQGKLAYQPKKQPTDSKPIAALKT